GNASVKPEGTVDDDHHDEGRDSANYEGARTGLNRVGAKRRTNRALLDNGQLGRQGARAKLNGQVVGALDSEIAGDLAGAAEDGLADHRCRQHLVVKHDGEWPAYVFLR